jgi:putative tryptophan/tyrosine transport system substrate-binding protein
MRVVSSQWSVVGTSIFSFALGAALFAFCFAANAQQPKKVSRIGYLSSTPNPGPQVEAFRRGLRELGYTEKKDFQIEYRHIEGRTERVPTLVGELIKLDIDVFVSPMPPAIRAAKQATKTIPIVMVVPTDPVTTGLVDSLARPGGNVTGLTRLTRELSGKRLELLQEVIPRISRVGVLWDNANEPALATALKEHEIAARALKIPLQSLEVRGPNPDFDGVFRDAAKGHVNALISTMTPLLVHYAKRIADLAIKNRLPLMVERGEFVEAGGLMSYSANDAEIFRRAAWYVDKILKGAKPGDLPVEQPTKFEFLINLKTAKALNLTIPQSVLYRADKVIK